MDDAQKMGRSIKWVRFAKMPRLGLVLGEVEAGDVDGEGRGDGLAAAPALEAFEAGEDAVQPAQQGGLVAGVLEGGAEEREAGLGVGHVLAVDLSGVVGMVRLGIDVLEGAGFPQQDKGPLGLHALGVGAVAFDAVLAVGDGAGLGAVEAGQAPVDDGDLLDEERFQRGGGGKLVLERLDEPVEVVAGLVGFQGRRDDGLGEDAVLEGVVATDGLALGRAGAGGFLGVAAVGGELFVGDTFGAGHAENLLWMELMFYPQYSDETGQFKGPGVGNFSLGLGILRLGGAVEGQLQSKVKSRRSGGRG